MKHYFSILILAVTATSVLAQGSLEREETGVQQAFETFGVTGSGTIVAILDRGIDWNHPGFKNEDGTTRIKYIFDMLDYTGANDPNNSYGVGTIYTEDQINDALENGTTLNTRDAVGHGTTTTGQACGNGAGSPNNIYKGMAPEASIIVVKLVSDGAPAHDDQSAETAFYDPSYIPIAIDFVVDKAAELNMPAVMLLNIGSQGGPSDGTSGMARKISNTVGPGIPGLVFVTGSSDDGGMANKAAGTVSLNGTTDILIEKGREGNLRFDLWYSEADRFNVTIETPNGGIFGPYPAPLFSDYKSKGAFIYHQRGENSDFHNAANYKREILVDIHGEVGQYKISLTGTTVSDGTFQATLNPSSIIYGEPYNIFLNHVVEGSIWDAASAFHNIVPNSYVLRNEWVDIDGFTRSFTGQGEPGELWIGSGIGPTFDGRIGIDVSAPGDRNITAYAPNSYWATNRAALVEDGNGLYGVAGAVSAANPMVTGIISLLLEVDPTLDASEIKSILQESAKSDEFTGETPNTSWGYGKVNAFGAIEAVYERLSSVPIISGNLVSEAISNSGISLSWSNIGLADHIVIERSESENGEYSQIHEAAADFTEFIDSELSESTTYFYRIYATNQFGNSDFSNVTSSTTFSLPAISGELTSETLSESEIKLSWNGSATNSDGIIIERSESENDEYSQIHEAAADFTEFIDSELSESTTYFYRIYATNQFGNSDFSNVTSSTTFSLPAISGELTSETLSESEIKLSWNGSATNSDGIIIERSESENDEYSQIHEAAADFTEFIDSELSESTTYFYRIYATNQFGNSDFSNVTSSTTFSLPAISGELTSETLSESEIKLSWNGSATNSDGIVIERSENENGEYSQIHEAAADFTEFIDSELSESTTYFYRIYATNQFGNSGFSNVTSSTTLAMVLSIESANSIYETLIFPNPSNGVLNIELPRGLIGRFVITGVSGKAIRTGQIESQAILDLRDLKSGNYVTQIFYENKVEVFRIIIE